MGSSRSWVFIVSARPGDSRAAFLLAWRGSLSWGNSYLSNLNICLGIEVQIRYLDLQKILCHNKYSQFFFIFLIFLTLDPHKITAKTFYYINM
jgi:hypothetical protein